MRLLLILVVGFSANLEAKEIAEKDYWGCESALWQSRQELDIEKFMSFIHPDFKGWPPGFDKPVSKDEMYEPFLKMFKTQYKTIEVNVTPIRIAIRGNVAITHFFLTGHYVSTDSTVSDWKTNETHVWDLSQGECLLLGGMGVNNS